MAGENKGLLIDTFPKRPGEEIRITVEEFQGRMRVNIRTWWQNDFGEWRPGKQGISLTPDQMRALLQALPRADQALKDEGL
jgi:hypothetical protein